MSRLPPSLGESALPDLVLSRYEVPLPPTRQELVAAIETILNGNGVQKMVVEVGHPIQVSQLVNRSMAEPPKEYIPSDDLWGQMRNGERLQELTIQRLPDGSLPDGYRALFFAFDELFRKKLKPLRIFYHNENQLRSWLSLSASYPLNLHNIYGVSTADHLDVPEDAIILVGIAHDENPETLTGLRVPVDLPD
jgi:hypothetical protein